MDISCRRRMLACLATMIFHHVFQVEANLRLNLSTLDSSTNRPHMFPEPKCTHPQTLVLFPEKDSCYFLLPLFE